MKNQVSEFHPKSKSFNLPNAKHLIYLSELAYKPRRVIRDSLHRKGIILHHFVSINDTQAIICGTEDYICIAFRGTETFNINDWYTDANIMLTPACYGHVHLGFKIGVNRAWPKILEVLKEVRKKQPVWLTGHSLGGALAHLTAARMTKKNMQVQGVYTFGCPRVGDMTFATDINMRIRHKLFRVVNDNDIVTRTPPRFLGYRHCGQVYYIDQLGTIHEDPSFWKKFINEIPLSLKEMNPLDAFCDHPVESYRETISYAILAKDK